MRVSDDGSCGMSLRERGQRGEEKRGVGRLEVKGRRGGRRGGVGRKGGVKGRRGGGEEDGGERGVEERWRGGRVGVKESWEARRICLSDSCYWPFFSPLPEMVELRPDRGDLNPFLSGRRLGPCEGEAVRHSGKVKLLRSLGADKFILDVNFKMVRFAIIFGPSLYFQFYELKRQHSS